MLAAYHAIPPSPEYIAIPASPDAPMGPKEEHDEEPDEKKLAPLPPYDPTSWRETLFVLKGRPFVEEGTRTPLLLLWALGSGIVVLSALIGGKSLAV